MLELLLFVPMTDNVGTIVVFFDDGNVGTIVVCSDDGQCWNYSCLF